MTMGVTVSHMQAGWLLILKKGFLHRDISIGNILTLRLPLKSCPSELLTGDKDDLDKLVKRLKEAVKNVDLWEECYGFVIDGDMAASLEGYFTTREMGERSVGMFSDVEKPN